MTAASSGAARVISGRRIVMVSAIVVAVLSTVAGLTARASWLALGGAQPIPARLYGTAVWPDHTRRAAALGLPDQDGQVFTLPAQAGKAVVVAFWDPVCGSRCLTEARVLATTRTRLAATAPVELVVMSTGPAAGTPLAARALAARAGWDVWVWHWLFASPRRLAQIRRAYGGPASPAAAHAPALFLVGRDGYERASLRIPASGQQLVTDLRRLAGA